MTWNAAETICTCKDGSRWSRDPNTNRMRLIGAPGDDKPPALPPEPKRTIKLAATAAPIKPPRAARQPRSRDTSTRDLFE